MVLDDPTVGNLVEHGVQGNENEIGQCLASNSDMGNIDLTKALSNYPQGTTNLKIRASNEIIDVVDSEAEHSDSSDSDGVKKVVMDTISIESNNSFPISAQMDANVHKKLSLNNDKAISEEMDSQNQVVQQSKGARNKNKQDSDGDTQKSAPYVPNNKPFIISNNIGKVDSVTPKPTESFENQRIMMKITNLGAKTSLKIMLDPIKSLVLMPLLFLMHW